jgi:hypothetical protein
VVEVSMKTFCVIFAAIFLACLAYYGLTAGVARYRIRRAHVAEIRRDDDDLREWASQPAEDPLQAKLRDCIVRLTYTQDGGYAEVSGTAAKECWAAHDKAARVKFDAEVAALGTKVNKLDPDVKVRLYDECLVEANEDSSVCYKTVYGP